MQQCIERGALIASVSRNCFDGVSGSTSTATGPLCLLVCASRCPEVLLFGDRGGKCRAPQLPIYRGLTPDTKAEFRRGATGEDSLHSTGYLTHM